MELDTSLTIPQIQGHPVISFVVRKEWRAAKEEIQKEKERALKFAEGDWFTFEFSAREDDAQMPRRITELSFMGIEAAMEMAARLLDPKVESPEYDLTVKLASMTKKSKKEIE